MLAKSLGVTSDNVTYDLEDSVTANLKEVARRQLRDHLLETGAARRRPDGAGAGVSEVAVRINAVSTAHALADLTELAPALAGGYVDAVVIPKVQGPGDLTFVADALRHLAPERHRTSNSNSNSNGGRNPGPVKLLALIESARGVTDLREICGAPGPAGSQLSGLVFAAEDFALDLSLTRTPSLREFLYARSAIATAARAWGLPSAVDLVCTSFRGEEGAVRLEEECRDGRGLGFNGKQCIHPDQVALVQRLFGPDHREVEWAVRVLVADEKAAAQGRGAFPLDGSMIDAPVSGRAREVVQKAERCGIDVEELRQKWKDQEPESLRERKPSRHLRE